VSPSPFGFGSGFTSRTRGREAHGVMGFALCLAFAFALALALGFDFDFDFTHLDLRRCSQAYRARSWPEHEIRTKLKGNTRLGKPANGPRAISTTNARNLCQRECLVTTLYRTSKREALLALLELRQRRSLWVSWLVLVGPG
jgi:hypothetical protein